MSKEDYNIELIREFVKKDYQTVSARFVKRLLLYFDQKDAEISRLQARVKELEGEVKTLKSAL